MSALFFSPGICLAPGPPGPPLQASLPLAPGLPGTVLGWRWPWGGPRGLAVPHARGLCLTEEDGQPGVPGRAGLRGRHPADVLKLLQVQPPGPRGGGHGQEAAGEPGAGGRRHSGRASGASSRGRRRVGGSRDLTHEPGAGGRRRSGRALGRASGASSRGRRRVGECPGTSPTSTFLLSGG